MNICTRILMVLLIMFNCIGCSRFWKKEVDIPRTTIAEALQQIEHPNDIELFLESLYIPLDGPLGEPVWQSKILGQELYHVIVLKGSITLNKDYIYSYQNMLNFPFHKIKAPHPENFISIESCIKEVEGMLALDIWGTGELEDFEYDIQVQPGYEKEEVIIVQINAMRSYKGYECAGNIRFSVNREKGEIVLIKNFPFIAPESLDVKISKDEALAIATQYAQENGWSQKAHEIKQFITHTDNFDREDPTKKDELSLKTEFCWQVKFNYDSWIVTIDCATGEIYDDIIKP